MKTTDGIIYLASNRERRDMEKYRSLRTITLDKPFNNIVGFWDDTLTPKESAHYIASTTHFLLPLVGDIETTQTLSPGQAQLISGQVSIRNPFDEELINYLHLMFNSTALNAITEFDLDQNKNSLVTLFPGIYLGKYDGRRDGVLKLNETTKGVFAFVIEGAFEVQNRLLEPRDGLALANITELEFEALSNEAMLLLVVTG